MFRILELSPRALDSHLFVLNEIFIKTNNLAGKCIRLWGTLGDYGRSTIQVTAGGMGKKKNRQIQDTLK